MDTRLLPRSAPCNDGCFLLSLLRIRKGCGGRRAAAMPSQPTASYRAPCGKLIARDARDPPTSPSHYLTDEIGYFTDEKLVGCRNEFATRCTIGPFASVSARWRCHSGSAWKVFHFFSRSASDSHFNR